MHDVIDDCAVALRADIGAFTRRNLRHALGRTLCREVDEAELEAALRSRLERGALPGLLPVRCTWRSRRLGREWEAYFPKAILLVDRRPILDLFVASGTIPSARIAVVCIDGSPSPVVAWLRRGFRSGRQVPVAYLHDAATVVYPFAVEPIAALAESARSEPLVYRDLGLPPLGVPASRFHAPSALPGETIVELEALPPATLIRYGIRAAARLAPGDPNMLPLRRDSERGRPQEARP
jgi:hypothetical protein